MLADIIVQVWLLSYVSNIVSHHRRPFVYTHLSAGELPNWHLIGPGMRHWLDAGYILTHKF